MHELTPPQEVEELNPLLLEGMTPQQAVEWLSQLERELNPLQLEGITPQQMVERFRQRDEEIRQLREENRQLREENRQPREEDRQRNEEYRQLREENRQRNEEYRQLREENRQLREVIGRGVFTPRMDEQPSRPMEEMDIGTTPEAMPKTLNNLRSLLRFVREVSILTFCLVARFLPEAKASRKISTDWSYVLVLFFECLTVNRLFGVFDSYLRKDPAKEFLWSIFNLLVSAPVHYVAYDYLSRQENPPISECLLLSIFTIASGISPDTAEFVNYRILRMLLDWSLSCIAGQFKKWGRKLTKWAEKLIRWTSN